MIEKYMWKPEVYWNHSECNNYVWFCSAYH